MAAELKTDNREYITWEYEQLKFGLLGGFKIEGLERMRVSWTEDMEGYYKNNNIPVPENISWKIFADILMAATMYE